jgi:hypothetical protein
VPALFVRDSPQGVALRLLHFECELVAALPLQTQTFQSFQWVQPLLILPGSRGGKDSALTRASEVTDANPAAVWNVWNPWND